MTVSCFLGMQVNDWNAELTQQAQQHGGEILADELVTQQMHFSSVDDFYEVRHCTLFRKTMCLTIAPMH